MSNIKLNHRVTKQCTVETHTHTRVPRFENVQHQKHTYTHVPRLEKV